MKQTLILLLVFAVAVVATVFLLLGGDVFKTRSYESPETGGVEDPGIDPARKRSAEITRTMVNPGAARDERPVKTATDSQATVGAIEGTVKTDDGLPTRNLVVSVFPPGPVANLQGDRFFLTNLASGTYYVGVTAEGYLARQAAEVAVEAGYTHKIDLWLDRGIELRGIVHDDVEQRPIAGAMIDFNGVGNATTDAYGAFRTGIVPPRALDIITLTHDEYDRVEMIHPVIPEPQGITLAMSRGRTAVSGRIIAAPGEPAPAVFRVRVIRIQMEGYEQLRRERTFRDTTTFEIKGIFEGTNALEVAFPGTTYAYRRIEFEVGRNVPAVTVDVDLAQGGTIDGTYVAPTGLVASIPILLVDSKAHRMGEARTDALGKFRFDHATAGEYAIRMDARIPPLHTETFKVEDGKIATITVNAQTGRLGK